MSGVRQRQPGAVTEQRFWWPGSPREYTSRRDPALQQAPGTVGAETSSVKSPAPPPTSYDPLPRLDLPANQCNRSRASRPRILPGSDCSRRKTAASRRSAPTEPGAMVAIRVRRGSGRSASAHDVVLPFPTGNPEGSPRFTETFRCRACCPTPGLFGGEKRCVGREDRVTYWGDPEACLLDQ